MFQTATVRPATQDKRIEAFWEPQQFMRTMERCAARLEARVNRPREIRGTAAHFEKLMQPYIRSTAGEVLNGKFDYLVSGCLDSWFRDYRAGRKRIELLVNHDLAEVLATSSGPNDCFSLRLSKDGNRVLFRLRPRGAAGRTAMAVVKASGLTGLSLALHGFCTEFIDDVLFVWEADILNLSLVETPAGPGCRLRLVY